MSPNVPLLSVTLSTIGRQVGLALVTSMDIRRYVRKMIEPHLEWLRVYSYQELGSLIELRPIGRVT